jgi:hypothetical protein
MPEVAQMIETSNADVDVDALMARLRERVSALRARNEPDVSVTAITLRTAVFVNSLEALVNLADQRAQVRTHWPSHFHGPIFGLPALQKIALRGLALIFKDQRNVNQALIGAFRESIGLNRHLIEQIGLLRDELEVVKRALRER